MTALLRRHPAIWMALGAWGVAVLVGLTPGWRTLELRVFDWLTTRVGAPLPPSPIVLVGIDEPSFAELGVQWPWPRGYHARLVDALREAGAAVIAFDVVFAEPAADATQDALFAEAIRRARNVVLAADETLDEGSHVIQKLLTEAHPGLLGAGATSGVVAVPIDRDGVVRRLPRGEDRFWRAILDRFGDARREAVAVPRLRAGDLIYYSGPGRPFPYANYYQALDPKGFLPPDFFRDRIVLVGLSLQASPDPSARQTDMFVTPLFAVSERLTPGFEIHGHILATTLHGRVRREAPWWLGGLAGAALALVGGYLMRTWTPVGSGAVGVGLLAGVGVLTTAAFRLHDRWVFALELMLVVVLLYVGHGGLAFLQEQAMRRQIKRTFSQYVSHHVVEEMLAHPERLALGGERRELTLLFADLAGFTSMSERIPPEEVAKILNRCLTRVTRIVVEHGGTVDKYMGDAIMAFWGAPLDDPEHALHACQAAGKMQETLAQLREEFAREGRPPVSMRIGINSGVVVVGNMGSETLFDYTAIGDDVNLASRLEGVNKVYGTPILLSEATVRHTAGRIPVRPVDRVQVKGKKVPVDIFTVEADPRVTELTTRAIEAYRRTDWAAAELAWKEVLVLRPDDPIAPIYLERIAGYRQAPPPPDWDGALELHEK